MQIVLVDSQIYDSFNSSGETIPQHIMKNTTITLTEMEAKVLNYLREDGWYNWGGEPHFSDVDASDVCYATGISKTSIGGVLGSLSKKGLISVEDCDVNGENSYELIHATAATYRFFGEVSEELEEDEARWASICAE